MAHSNNVQTPERYNPGKKLHTPPSASATTPRHTPGKFLRAISGKVFRKSVDGKLDDIKNVTRQFILNETNKQNIGKRTNIPKPLVLGSPMSLPPSAKKNSNFYVRADNDIVKQQLQSPVGFTSRALKSSTSNKSNRRNLTNTLLIESLSQIPELPKNKNEDILIWSDNMENDTDSVSTTDLMSPLYYKKQNSSRRVTSAMGLKKYVGERCVICEENVSSSFQGEKIIELDCGHASHYKCYYIAMEMLYGTENFPKCDICHKEVRPMDKESLIEIESNILTGTKENEQEEFDDVKLTADSNVTSGIIAQWVPLKSARTPGKKDFMSLVTPLEQILVPGQIGSNGFKTPTLSIKEQELSIISGNNVFIDECNNDEIYQEILKLTEETDTFTYEDSSDLNVNFKDSIVTLENLTKKDNNDVEQQFIKVELSVPTEDIPTTPLNTKNETSLLEDGSLQTREDEIRRSITEDICSKQNCLRDYVEDNMDSNILAFDEVEYSLEGENWFQGTSLYYFDECLVLVNNSKDSISGKVPIVQISSISKIDDKRALLVCLKSTTLPELYLQFKDRRNNSNMLLNKWQYYLSNLNEKPSLHPECISLAMMDKLSSHTNEQIRKYSMNVNYSLPWDKTNVETPCRVIICLGLSPSTIQEKEDGSYLKKLHTSINSVRDSLNENDLLGIVFAGKSGNGIADAMSGTFVGTMPVSWSGWSDLIEDITTVTPGLFLTPEREQVAMFSTCCRLASTIIESDSEKPCYYNRTIIIQESNQVDEDGGAIPLINKYKSRLETMYNFEVSYVSLTESTLILEKEIQECHSRNMTNVIVKIGVAADQIQMNFGSMGPGSIKTVEYQLDEGRELIRNRVCDLSWYDVRLQELFTNSSVPLNHIYDK